MAAAYRMTSLNSWPTAWHHCGHGKKAQTSLERRLFVGQWHDTVPRSPAAVEARLRDILRGVGLMVDRATFTLAKTSY
ncbi:hypothetical protein QL093DRAFT_2373348 [Fusarium oxysporum]|nr:hypothetical protein QL093DRAFT_2373348 [Fusarium oxysporum]